MCIGAATCVVYAPSTFDIDDENIAIVKQGEWDRLEKIVAAAQSCPVVAIEVYQDGRKLYPKEKR
jgi:ferredoxin